MENLNNHQLILIVLLVTFVTSIATGIITFTLLSEAPVEVTQTINRVVEKTIERVVPEEGGSEQLVTTVVVSEEDKILDTITGNEKSIVRLKLAGADGSEVFAGMGIVVSNTGVIMTDSRSYISSQPSVIVFYDGKTYPTGRIFRDEDKGLVFVKANVPKTDGSNYAFYPASFGDSDKLKIGQTLVAISGSNSNAASVGRIYQLSFSPDRKIVTEIFSDVKISKIHLGSPIINLSGEIVGIEAPPGETDIEYSYVPINGIKSAIAEALKELAE